MKIAIRFTLCLVIVFFTPVITFKYDNDWITIICAICWTLAQLQLMDDGHKLLGGN